MKRNHFETGNGDRAVTAVVITLNCCLEGEKGRDRY